MWNSGFTVLSRKQAQAVNDVLSADLVLAEMRSPVPADEMIEAMRRTGRMLPR